MGSRERVNRGISRGGTRQSKGQMRVSIEGPTEGGQLREQQRGVNQGTSYYSSGVRRGESKCASMHGEQQGTPTPHCSTCKQLKHRSLNEEEKITEFINAGLCGYTIRRVTAHTDSVKSTTQLCMQMLLLQAMAQQNQLSVYTQLLIFIS